MIQDLRHACRTLARSPGFSAVATATLAIAIGVNASVFSMVNGLLLRPVIPLRPAEVVNVFTARKEANRDYRQFSYAEFSALREANPVFRDVAALSFTLTGVGRAEAMRRSFVFFTSDNFFALVGVQPAAGRFFTAEETRPNANLQVVVASWPLWQRMGGRPDFVGSTLQVNGRPFTVVGVTPRGFRGVNLVLTPDVWIPLGVFSQFTAMTDSPRSSDLSSPTAYVLNLMARLQPGVDVRSAPTMLGVLERRLNALQPPGTAGAAQRDLQVQSPSRLSVSSSPSQDGPINAMAALLLAMAAVVLLIACLNLANMLLARNTARAREFAIRLSVGASRWRIVRQLLVEGFVLALAGGLLGLLIAQWTDDLLTQSFNRMFEAMNFSLVLELAPDANVLGMTFLFALAATLMFSLGPAIRSVRTDVVHDLKQQAGEAAGGGSWNRFFSGRHCLVLVQLALSLVLLSCGGLFLRGAINAASLALGFSTAGGVVAEIDYSLTHTEEAAARARMLAILARVQQLPGVQQAALTTLLPYTNITTDRQVLASESAARADPKAPPPQFGAVYAGITPGFFEAMGIPLLRGRSFTAGETESPSGPPIAVIDARLAAQLYPGGDALGRHLRYATPPAGEAPSEIEIVGIVASHRHEPGTGEPPGHLYLPLARSFSSDVFLNVLLSRHDASLVNAELAALRGELRKLDPEIPLLRLTPLARIVDGNAGLWVIKLGAVLFGTFGSIALLLAIVGVYGVKAYTVARRTREIGIRMALGARPADVFRLIMGQGFWQTLTAITAGVALSLLLGRALAGMLFQVSPSDPLILGGAASVLAATALLACYLPARRATRVSPLQALRSE